MPRIIYPILYILTIISTYLTAGWGYALALMTILTAHELGHYLANLRYGMRSTLPLFIPFPFSPFGTLGAVIQMRGEVPNRRALFDIGAAGPLSGLAFAIPATIVGLRYSQVVPLNQIQQPVMRLGDSLLFTLLQRLTLGRIPEGYDVILHPVAYAGWVGLFVTALNLLPIGQLDGGHIIYSMFGKRSRWVSHGTLGILSLVCIFYNPQWLLLVVILFIFGRKHPRPMDDNLPLDVTRRNLGILMMIIFILAFIPIPFPEYVKTLKEVWV